MGRMQRQKGKRGEREAAAELAAVLGVTARRGVQYQGGPDSPDVVLTGVDVHVEVKRTERLDLYAAVEQATSDAAGKVPIVYHRRNHKPSLVIVETSRLMELVQALANAKGTSGVG
jgi:Holliday junction resolvase